MIVICFRGSREALWLDSEDIRDADPYIEGREGEVECVLSILDGHCITYDAQDLANFRKVEIKADRRHNASLLPPM